MIDPVFAAGLCVMVSMMLFSAGFLVHIIGQQVIAWRAVRAYDSRRARRRSAMRRRYGLAG